MQSLETNNTIELTDQSNLADVQPGWTSKTNSLSKYEIVLCHVSGSAWRVAYTPRKTRVGIVNAVRNCWNEIESKAGRQTWRYAKSSADGLFSGGWTIRFSGRTEREAKSSMSHLRWVGGLK